MSKYYVRKKYLSFLSYISLMSYALVITVIGPVVSQIQSDLKIGDIQIGFLLTCQFTGFILSLLFGGYLVDRYGIKLVQITGQFALCVGSFLFSFANSYLTLLLSAPLIGISGAFVEIATNTTIATLHRESRSSSLNLLHVFFGIGALLGPFFSGYMISCKIHWHYVYLAVFCFSLPPLFFFLFQRFPEAKTNKTILVSYMLKNNLVIHIGIISLLYAGVEFAINTFAVSYMEKFLSKLTASSFLTLFWFFVTVGRILCVFLGKKTSEENLLFLLSFFSVIFFFAFLLSKNPISLGINISLCGLSFSGIFAVLIAIVTDRFPEYVGITTSVVILFAGIGMALFPYIAGIISDTFSTEAAFFVMWGFIILMSMLSYLLKKNKRVF